MNLKKVIASLLSIIIMSTMLIGCYNYKDINVGVILSGGQAPGGHNVISGLFDGINTGGCFV